MGNRFLIPLFLVVVCSCSKSETDEKSDGAGAVDRHKWISEVVEYRPAPGQFINTSLGDPDGVKDIVGKLGHEISLGGFGGSITFKFDHRVKNIEGPDFVIFGNAFQGSSEPGIVMVQSGGEWYELKGSEYAKTVKNYEITYTKPANDNDDVAWTDNQSKNGVIEKVSFHTQAYFPNFLNTTTLTFKGSLASLSILQEGMTWVLNALEWGYVDNFSADYNEIVGGDQDTKGSNKFDLSNAVDGNGNGVTLTEIDAVKVYNCINNQAGILGECSTEIRGAISLTVK